MTYVGSDTAIRGPAAPTHYRSGLLNQLAMTIGGLLLSALWLLHKVVGKRVGTSKLHAPKNLWPHQLDDVGLYQDDFGAYALTVTVENHPKPDRNTQCPMCPSFLTKGARPVPEASKR